MLTSCDDLVNESEGGVANFKLFVVYSDNLFSLYDKIWTKNEFYNNKKKINQRQQRSYDFQHSNKMFNIERFIDKFCGHVFERLIEISYF